MGCYATCAFPAPGPGSGVLDPSNEENHRPPLAMDSTARRRWGIPSGFRIMIRIETDTGWTLIEHREHARLAGRFASHWGNAEFAAPEPRADILLAVDRHDDAWVKRDAVPFLTREGKPSAFSQELVGKYGAFEEIDLEDYLAVRGAATEAVAAESPYAAIIVSMHTYDLLTAQADPRGLTEEERALHRKFLDGQLQRQVELIDQLSAGPELTEDLAPAQVLRAFEFLQACDSLSLAVCVRFPKRIVLRHRHPRRDETLAEIFCTPLGGDTFRIAPYPFEKDELILDVPCRSVPGKTFASEAAFRAAYAAAPVARLQVKIKR